MGIGQPIATVVLWSRLRLGPLSCLARGFGVFASQLVAVLLAAVFVNNYGFFYSSWTDLFTTGQPTTSIFSSTDPHVPGKGGNPATAGGITTTTYPSYSTPSQRNKWGRIDTVTIDGASTGLTSQGYVNTAAFLKLAKPPLVVDTIIEQHGGHNFDTWSKQIPIALSWLSKKLPSAEAR